MASFYKLLDDIAVDAAQKIRRDLTDRRGFRQVWSETPVKTHCELLDVWKSIVINAVLSTLTSCPTCSGEGDGCMDPWHGLTKAEYKKDAKRSL